MPYNVNGTEYETDDLGYLLEPEYDDEIVPVIAQAENISLTDAHWEVIHFLRDAYRDNGQTPNFRNMLKALSADRPEIDSQYLYDLFPLGPAKQAVKIAGLPQPLGKGGY